MEEESDINGKIYFLVLVGKISNPSITKFIYLQKLVSSPNHSIVVQIIDDVVCSLNVDRVNFVLLLHGQCWQRSEGPVSETLRCHLSITSSP